MFRHITADTILASVQALAAGKQPEIETGILLAHYLPQSLGLESALKMDAEPELLPLEYRRMQRRFHAQAVASWGVMGGRDGDYVLIPLGNEWEAAAPERNAAVAKGFHLCGTLGLTADNAPLVLTEPEPTAEDFAPLMQACLVSLWPKANGMPGTGTGTGNPPIPKDGPTAWLDELMALPDTRNTGTKGASMRKRFESVWAIRPEATLSVVRLMSREMAASNGPQTSGTGDAVMTGTHWEAARPSVRGKRPNKVAIVPIQGVLTNDGPSYYGSNYQTISDAVEKAATDPNVSKIILQVDSPGGEVTGLPETAAVIAAASKVKPVSTVVEGAAASAAYWLASQSSDITLTPSGEVGSVGVRMMHVDMSKMLEAEGYKVTELHSGDFKTEWSPYAPLSTDAKADMQARIVDSHGKFLQAITSGRGRRVSPELRAKRYGEGRMFSASKALLSGLVDHVQSARDFYRQHVGASTSSAARTTSVPMAVQRARLELERIKL